MRVAEILDDTIQWPAMTADVLAAFGSDVDTEFNAFLARVEGRFRTTSKYANVLRFLVDHSKLRDNELVALFEFIYSSLINNLKGELAELFARRRVRDFAELLLLKDATVVIGPRIRERARRRTRGWLKGADGLLCVDEERQITIAAVVEVKAMHHPVPRIIEQLQGHVSRMRAGGLKIGDDVFMPDAIDIRCPDGTIEPLETAANVPCLIIHPWLASENGAILPHPDSPNVWVAELAYTQDEITEAAYRLTDWFFARLGPIVFFRPGDEPVGRTPAPHPEDSLEENGRNAFRAALFGVWRRKIFQPRPADAPRGGKRTPADTFLWLYNSICGGYEQATTDDIFFPDFVPNDAYEERRARWVAARTALARTDFPMAVAAIPDPTEQSDVWSRRREWVLFARIHARAGNHERANAAIESAYAEAPSTNLAVPLERAATHALVAALGGRRATAADQLRSAGQMLTEARALIALHEREGYDYPADLDARSIETAMIDMAIAASLIGERDEALELLRDLAPIDSMEAERLANDPTLTALRAR
jgi:hypothetical protein